ncbi:MAG TPA: hypothetical protein VFN67_01140 [Polyangiales bacterium]|nr:hypothetical protein [Polyangiales bacterium]
MPDKTRDVPEPEERQNTAVLPADAAQDPRDVLLARAQAARRMGVSVATIRRMEGDELQPVIIDGKHCFALEDF